MKPADSSQVPDLKEHLLTRILPFWQHHSVDRDHGGFITHLARDGAITDASAKYLVMQARMVYSFATGAALGGEGEWMNLARQGAGFLLQHFRDVESDGWFWSVSREGAPRETGKRSYGHAFVAYALAEYGRIAGDGRALAAADHTWALVADRLWDREHGGVLEACDRIWIPTDVSHSMGTHLHVVEALLALREAVGADHYWPRVRAICDLMVRRMVEAEHGCGLEEFHPDWSLDEAASRGLINYGHNLEAAWLLLRVDEIEPMPAYRETARRFLDYSLRFGLDTGHGGVFSHGPPGQPATVRQKIWWVQTEALVAYLLGYLVFEKSRYWDAFRSVLGFCLEHLHDPEHGEWYHSAEEDGRPRDTHKGSAWKAAYHVTQALSYAHQYLGRLE
jgi:mannobiose 2-epimerase